VQALENRAYQALETCAALERRNATHQQRHGRADRTATSRLRHARPAAQAAVALADDVAALVRWLREDVLAVNGLSVAERTALYDFVLAELRRRTAGGPYRLQQLTTLLHHHRDHLLAFAVALEQDLTDLAQDFAVPVATARALLDVEVRPACDPRRWPADAALRQQLRGRYHGLRAAVAEVLRHTVRASSVIENLNSRLRTYFTLRRQLGPDYLALLQFFLNHRRFLRSEHPERVGHSPAELLTGQPQPHWLELLGYQRFTRS
jgi:hypothetical protein